MKLKSPAKLNLILKVVDKLPNNYHLLEMLNVLIDLEDIIEIHESEEIEIKYDKYQIDKTEDTIYKAVNDFITKYQLPKQSIYIIKNIPVGAGLGGVSSNVATILKYLNDFYKVGLTQEELIEFVLPYGTDICYLIYGLPAIVKGIGEKIVPIEMKEKFKILLIYPNIKISTKDIYNKVSKMSTPLLTPEYVKDGNIMEKLENDLEKVAFSQSSKLQELKNELQKYLNNIHMTGSGSTLFSIIDDDFNELDTLKSVFKDCIINIYNMKGDNMLENYQQEQNNEQVEQNNEQVEQNNTNEIEENKTEQTIEYEDPQIEIKKQFNEEIGIEFNQTLNKDDIYTFNRFLIKHNSSSYITRTVLLFAGALFIAMSIIEQKNYYMIVLGAALIIYTTVLYNVLRIAYLKNRLKKNPPEPIEINVKVGQKYIRYQLKEETDSPLVAFDNIYKAVKNGNYLYLYINRYSFIVIKLDALEHPDQLLEQIKKRYLPIKSYFEK